MVAMEVDESIVSSRVLSWCLWNFCMGELLQCLRKLQKAMLYSRIQAFTGAQLVCHQAWRTAAVHGVFHRAVDFVSESSIGGGDAHLGSSLVAATQGWYRVGFMPSISGLEVAMYLYLYGQHHTIYSVPTVQHCGSSTIFSD